MDRFPAFVDLKGRRVVAVGAGEALAAKARLFASAGAALDVVEETAGPAAPDFQGAALAVIAGLDDERAARLAAEARGAGVLVNVVDRPELSDFIVPSIVDRGEVTVAISTGGAAPVLARRLRASIESLLPARLGALAAFARAFRRAVAGKVAPPARRAFWERVFDGPIAARFLAGDEGGAREAMIEAINRSQTEEAAGVVHIVGAGPGDPDLLTLRALRLIQDADVILYDRLVGEDVLDLARRDAIRLYVGKAKADHAVPQAEIEARLIAYARAGKTVVRLKGGDPFVFGRGGEELEALRAAGVDVFVTPGITAATGCAAAAGMALTHRDRAQAVTFVTGHAKEGGEPDLDWAALASLGHTLVVYMGVSTADAIARRLVEAGRASETPVSLVENGTRPDQKIIKGALGDLGRLVADAGVEGPALLVIGEVAAFADGVGLTDLAHAAAQRSAA